VSQPRRTSYHGGHVLVQSIARGFRNALLVDNKRKYPPQRAAGNRDKDGEESHHEAGAARCERNRRAIGFAPTPVDPNTVVYLVRHAAELLQAKTGRLEKGFGELECLRSWWRTPRSALAAQGMCAMIKRPLSCHATLGNKLH
jgi:hypothetical protein